MIQRRKPMTPKGSVIKAAKESKVSINSIKTNYKNVLAEVNKVHSHGLSVEQKKHLKEMGYLSGIGKGKPLKK
jgi:hypothetical protein